MATSRWGIVITDNAGNPRTGLSVKLNTGGGGGLAYTLIESSNRAGFYYEDVDDGLYDLEVDGVVDSEYSGNSGFWIGGPDVQ
ncbi:MAG: hypothetical protein GF317_04880 [Candidatus Lokiarchaeota archaeon]|nr:hypothetical protein [Candidatus Lokiarchaeota archaeon]